MFESTEVGPEMNQTPNNDAISDWVTTPEGTNFTDQIHQIASGHLAGDTSSFEPAWKAFLIDFQGWAIQPPAQKTSALNLKLWFLQMLLKQFPQLSVLKTDPRVIDLALASCAKVGDKIAHPRFGECEITQRAIGDRFGVLYTLKTPNQLLVSFEFFD